ncbi:MAG: SDR family oxidoreductase [Candidatus Andeanibacterium colombiense]|uniref:SDR family oxidoreductase n=1 Tax=Candidatus Andeanibacterium colombiense TaxID=3121345 RepID=A0AAJ6BQH2_9SPHN|nr:MAG: SDR family oxidoreductase [Sphingomonadaceae bacterium]
MRVFLTGATGFIGSHIVPQLLGGGHSVLGMTRSAAGAEALAAAGASTHHAELGDLAAIRAGAAQADAVIHTAFDHDFSKFAANCEQDRQVIEALGEELKGSNRPLLITSGVGMGGQDDGGPALETIFNAGHPNPRIASELAGLAVRDAGVDVRVVRLPQVHDTTRQGLITYSIAIGREKGTAAYIGKGLNRWSAAHVADVAELYRLVLEKGQAGERYHAVAEEGVVARAIAEVVGAGLGVPVKSISPDEAADYFGWFGIFAGLDMAASSALTRERLQWNPTGPGLIEDLEAHDYSSAQ